MLIVAKNVKMKPTGSQKMERNLLKICHDLLQTILYNRHQISTWKSDSPLYEEIHATRNPILTISNSPSYNSRCKQINQETPFFLFLSLCEGPSFHSFYYQSSNPSLFFFLLPLLLIKSTGQVFLWIKNNSQDKWKKMESDTRDS